MQLTVLLFASYADAFGRDRVVLELPEGAHVADVVDALQRAEGGAGLPPRPLMAVNRRYAPYHRALGDADEVAVIPPVAGG